MTGNRKGNGITMGDPAGIIPQIIVKVLPEKRVHDLCPPMVVGNPECMRPAVEEIFKTSMKIHVAASVREARGEIGVMDVRPVGRTSVDHGTAFENAGKNAASPASMILATAHRARPTEASSWRRSDGQ